MSYKIKKLIEVDRYKWHSEIVINNCLILVNNNSGCGSMILQGWIDCSTQDLEEFREFLEDIKNQDFSNMKKQYGNYFNKLDIGMIQTVAGEDYYNDPGLKMLEELGFKEVAEYPNPRHGSTSKQKLYIWTIN